MYKNNKLIFFIKFEYLEIFLDNLISPTHQKNKKQEKLKEKVVNKINNFSLFSFFNFSKKLISNSNKNNTPSISNFDSNYYSLKSEKLPINIKSELNDINNIIYNTLTRACKNIRQMNNLEIFSLLKESLNIYDGK